MNPAEDDPFSAPRGGLPPRQYWEWNKAQPCAAPGCRSKRDSVGNYCRKHQRRYCNFGSLTRPHVEPARFHHTKRRTAKLLDASLEAGHPLALAAVERIRRLLAPGSFIHRESKHAYLQRLSAAGADPRAVVIEAIAVCAYLWRYDQDGYFEGDYIATQVTQRLWKLAPRKYQNGGEAKSLKRSKAMAGAVLEIVGPLASQMTAAMERDRRIRQARRKPQATNTARNTAA